ncbi:MAG: hypothetical protein KAR40_07380 [Candidatus Sabulitectum sp.]|nr:hypothetical protein [Candidatus Sabulitectum sp.]
MLTCLLILLSINGIHIVDTSGYSVAGAVLSEQGEQPAAFSNTAGIIQFETDPECTYSITALGYHSWTGSLQSESTVTLVPSPIQVFPITVTGRAWSNQSNRTSITTLDSKTVALTERIGLSSLMSLTPGFSIREYGGVIPVMGVSIRGSSSSQVSWQIGSHNLRQPGAGEPDAIPDLGMIQSVQIIRGGTSGLSGGGMAGTIVLTPKKPGMTQNSLSLFADNLGGFGIGSSYSNSDVALAGKFSRKLDERNSEGIFSSLLASFGTDPFKFGLLGSYSDANDEVGMNEDTTDTHKKLASADCWGKWSGNDNFSVAGGIHTGHMLYEATLPYPSDYSRWDGSADTKIEKQFLFGPATVSIGSDFVYDWITSSSVGNHRRGIAGLGLGIIRQIGDFNVSLTGREEVDTRGVTDWGAVTTLEYDPETVPVRSCLSFTRSFRNPTFNDLYWPEDTYSEGNPDLKGETARDFSLDTKVSLIGGKLVLGAAGWAGQSNDLITWQPDNEGIWRPVNFGSVVRSGFETTGAVNAGWFTLSGHVTKSLALIDDEDSDDHDNQLPYRPETTWGVSATGRFTPLTASVSLTGMGKQYTNTGNTENLEDYVITDIDVTFPIPTMNDISLSATVSNLLDVVYDSSNGFPGSSRKFRFEIDWAIN